jgi:hypothetical protein
MHRSKQRSLAAFLMQVEGLFRRFTARAELLGAEASKHHVRDLLRRSKLGFGGPDDIGN